LGHDTSSAPSIFINMIAILDTENVFEYLADLGYCSATDRDTSQIEIIPAKNFNLSIAFADGRNLLVKQEIHNDRGQARGEFWAAWQMRRLVEEFPSFGREISDFLPELLYFDPDRSILVVKFLADYSDLYGYYLKEHQFPLVVAKSIGQLLGTIHSQTFQRSAYHQFLTVRANLDNSYTAIDIIRRLSRITPRIFQVMPLECLQFFKLYQRFPSLSQAIADLASSITPSCLVHNDLKINNILLDLNWEQPTSKIIRLIDWERADWGDPAFDLGCILGSYLEIWLDGLVIGTTLSINESLQLATTPLELLQPSLFNLVRSYLDRFPAIMDARPDFLDRSIQFAGLSLIQRIEIRIDDYRLFGNRGIVMLQVAKQLLCAPQAAMNTLFGSESTQLIDK
jgi:Phosphotransferase enzyme family